MQATAIAQPNIALIKYWGKRDTERNLPAVGSISITLRDLHTRMHVEFDDALAADELTVNGAPDTKMLPRLASCLDRVAGEGRVRARIASDCRKCTRFSVATAPSRSRTNVHRIAGHGRPDRSTTARVRASSRGT